MPLGRETKSGGGERLQLLDWRAKARTKGVFFRRRQYYVRARYTRIRLDRRLGLFGRLLHIRAWQEAADKNCGTTPQGNGLQVGPILGSQRRFYIWVYLLQDA